MNHKYIECPEEESTHTEIKIGCHVDIYPNYTAKQYAGVYAERRYLKKIL